MYVRARIAKIGQIPTPSYSNRNRAQQLNSYGISCFTHPSQSNGNGSQADQTSLTRVGVGGESKLILQHIYNLLDLGVVVHHHVVLY